MKYGRLLLKRYVSTVDYVFFLIMSRATRRGRCKVKSFSRGFKEPKEVLLETQECCLNVRMDTSKMCAANKNLFLIWKEKNSFRHCAQVGPNFGNNTLIRKNGISENIF